MSNTAFFTDQFELLVEYKKLEVFYFSRSTRNFNPSPLDLTSLEGLILQPRISRNTLDLFSTVNFLFANMFTFTPTKPFLQLRV